MRKLISVKQHQSSKWVAGIGTASRSGQPERVGSENARRSVKMELLKVMEPTSIWSSSVLRKTAANANKGWTKTVIGHQCDWETQKTVWQFPWFSGVLIVFYLRQIPIQHSDERGVCFAWKTRNTGTGGFIMSDPKECFWPEQSCPKYLRFGIHGRRDVSLPKSGLNPVPSATSTSCVTLTTENSVNYH